MILFEIDGPPIPLSRPRSCRKGNFVSIYDSQKKEKAQTQWQIKSFYRESPLSVPLAVELTFYMPIPKMTSKIKKRLMLQGNIHHITKPDIDNLEKYVLDCMNGIVYTDDSHIDVMVCYKKYSEKPRTVVKIQCLDDFFHEENKKKQSEEKNEDKI